MKKSCVRDSYFSQSCGELSDLSQYAGNFLQDEMWHDSPFPLAGGHGAAFRNSSEKLQEILSSS
jgi:hypothetical protein